MKPSRRLLALAVLALLVFVVWFAFRTDGSPGVIELSGTVEATEAVLGFQVPGRIERIVVAEGARVETGDILATLDASELDARVRSADAQAAAAHARLRELQSGFRSEEVAQGEATLRAAQRRATEARTEYERATRLFDGGAISARQRDQAQTMLEVATSDLQRASEQLDILKSGAREEQILAQRAVAAQADAQVDQLRATLEQATILAPFTGIVAIRHREPGETVAPGVAVVTLRNPADRWVRVYVPEADFGRVSIGTPAEIRADPFPDRVFTGVVRFMADEAEFTPRTVQTSEERVKLVFRIKVRITGDSLFALKPGLPADVRLLTDQP